MRDADGPGSGPEHLGKPVSRDAVHSPAGGEAGPCQYRHGVCPVSVGGRSGPVHSGGPVPAGQSLCRQRLGPAVFPAGRRAGYAGNDGPDPAAGPVGIRRVHRRRGGPQHRSDGRGPDHPGEHRRPGLPAVSFGGVPVYRSPDGLRVGPAAAGHEPCKAIPRKERG